MSEIQRLPTMNNPIHPNTKTTTQITNGTTTTKSNISSPVCRNCKTQTTPLWRRDETGQVLCNACGLFLKLHGRARPISLKTDTIKLRNRIKQPNFNKSLSPNTPELKLKDAKASAGNGARDSPKTVKKKSGNNSPLDSVYSGSGSLKALPLPGPSLGTQSPLQHNTARMPYSGLSLSQHLGRISGNFPPQVQLLNYPSSTPAQFAPGLQRITSPLLLSTTLSILNARSSQDLPVAFKNLTSVGQTKGSSYEPKQAALTDAQAAGALENMSNELGPSASLKGLPTANGVLLIAPTGRKPIIDATGLSTPSSALNHAGNTPTFPSLGSKGDSSAENVIVSPSFGPQYHYNENFIKSEGSSHPKPSLPPISSLTHRGPTAALPHFSVATGTSSASGTPSLTPVDYQKDHISLNNKPIDNSLGNGAVYAKSRIASNDSRSFPSVATVSSAPQRHEQGSNMASGGNNALGGSNNDNSASSGPSGFNGPPGGSNNESSNNSSSNNNNNNNNSNGQNNGAGSNSYQFSVLKTRISELELVNDLYRTRIMELEAMEQAARLREQSMRRRLDEFLLEQGQSGSATVLKDTMKILKREGEDNEDPSKKQKMV